MQHQDPSSTSPNKELDSSEAIQNETADRDSTQIRSVDIQCELNRLEEMILDSPRIPLSRRTLIDEEQILDQLDLIRLGLPSAFQEAVEIVRHKDEILPEAEQYAQEILEAAERRAAQILDDMGLTRQAELEAQQIRQQVQQECEALCEQTISEIDRMRQRQTQQKLENIQRRSVAEVEKIQAEADAYADIVLREVEKQLAEMLRVIRIGRQQQSQVNQLENQQSITDQSSLEQTTLANEEVESLSATVNFQNALSIESILETGQSKLNEFPLLDLFTHLQKAGLALGIDEYFLVLRALQKGFGTADRESLADLCRTLWVKSKDEEHLFNYHFKQVMQTASASTSLSFTEAKQGSLQSLPASNVRQEKLDTGGSTVPTTSTSIFQELIEVEDEIQVAEAVQIAARSDMEAVIDRFTHSDEYFPVTRRQMKQNWRHLRRMVREGLTMEIDIEATIERFSQQGIPLEPVMMPGRVNRTELLLLVDQKGSMVPFHALSQRLAETAQRGGRLGEAGVFYFHNCPTQYLYRDSSRQQAELVSNLLAKLRPERSVVLIFSDGGAARGGFNPQRLELTNQFLDQIKERVRYLSWLNPMPKERWVGTTAGEIAQRVPMFEMSRRGMEAAIDVLRGRSLQVIG